MMTIEQIKQELRGRIANHVNYGSAILDYSPSHYQSDRALLTAVVALEEIQNLASSHISVLEAHKALRTICEQWSESN